MREPFAYPVFYRAPISDNALAQMAVANMNPNRPDADIGVSIAELRELPGLLRDGTDILAHLPGPRRHSAKANIIAQFGIRPIISDLVKLFDFVNVVDRREKYLCELSSGFKRIKRKITEESWDAVAPDQPAWPAVADNLTTTNKCRISCHATRTYWYTARAKLICPLTERDIKSLSAAIAYGVNTITAKQLWELVPWSWLIDWFSTTGDILAAFRGGLKWKWEGLNIMHSTTYYMTMFFPNIRLGFTPSPMNPNSKAVVKYRRQPSLSIYPEWRIPYLGFAQVSILLSLAILRVK
jgi:hypothetical protein